MEASDASLKNVFLNISLKRVVPEAMKPRRIEIAGNGDKIEAPRDGASQGGPIP